MLPINLMLARHRYPTTYKVREVSKIILSGIGVTVFIVMAVIVMPLFLPILLLNEIANKLTQCRKCGRFGGLRRFHPAKDGGTFYLCVRCKGRYAGYGNTWQDASAPEYDVYFGKHQNVRSLLRAATRPEESGAELVRPSLSTTVGTPTEQLVRAAREQP